MYRNDEGNDGDGCDLAEKKKRCAANEDADNGW